MKCKRMDELLPDYLLGDTDETTKAEVRSHLEVCAGCREELEGLDFIWRRLGTWPEEKAPEGLRARFYGMLEGYREGLAAATLARWRAKAGAWTQGWSPVRLAFQSGVALVFLSSRDALGLPVESRRSEAMSSSWNYATRCIT